MQKAMRYRCLGRTDLPVSEISLGTVELGLDYGFAAEGEPRRPTFAEAENLLHRALNLGVNFVDTARAYGDSEDIIGRALCGRRGEYYLASKVQTFAGLGEAGYEKMTASIEESLRTLRTDAFDFLLLHSVTLEELAAGRVTEVLLEARRRGLTKYIGASVYGPDAARAAILSGDFDCVQLAWSMLDRRPELEVLSLASEKNVGLVVRSVLMRGALTHRRTHLPPGLGAIGRAAEQLERIAGSAGMTLPDLAYRYVLSHSGPLTALVGTARVAELEAAVSVSPRGALPESVLAAIREVALEDPSLADLGQWPS
jgi:aryl-alcohol dehydrogenase-like predicted oxidoreductase